ncbi:MAG: HD domain-containing protein [Candidatus Latescibacterota bacterium]|nr:MAG: HD domain-containing protein [Candidatus Latescibacterota bacterium]
MGLTPWQKELVAAGELYHVGGAVRNQMMGTAGADDEVDYLVRGLPPKDLERILQRHGRLVLVGKSFGVYKFKPRRGKGDIDIAYPRTEISTGTGHRDFRVRWDWKLGVEADLGRRDFTINAIARSLNDGRIIDPCGGADDIKRRILRMVFPDAFREDPLRILRGVRFATRFSLEIDDTTLEAMKESAQLVDTLSAERVQDELNKLLTQCDRPSDGFSLMHTIGVLAHILPELQRGVGVTQNEFHPDDVFWHSVKSCDHAPKDNLIVRWAALLHDLGKVDMKQVVEEEGKEPKTVFYRHEQESATIASDVLKRLRYSNDFVKRCVHLVESHMFFYREEWSRGTVRRFIRRIGEENLDDLFDLRRADCRSRDEDDKVGKLAELRARIDVEIYEEKAFKLSDLAIDGGDVKEVLGIEEGPEIGRILREVFEMVLDAPGLNTRETLRGILSEKYGRREQ